MQCILQEKFNQTFTEGGTTAENFQTSNEANKEEDEGASKESLNSNSLANTNVGRKLIKKDLQASSSHSYFVDYVRKALNKLNLNNEMVRIFF